MSRKSNTRKSVTLWEKCECCNAIIAHKDHFAHLNHCPPSSEKWHHSYIKDGVVYSTVEQFESAESLKNLPAEETEQLVMLSQSALQICEMTIGDPVVISSLNCTAVKFAWPTADRSLTSVSMLKEGLDVFRGQFGAPVTVTKLPEAPYPAMEVCINVLSSFEPPSDLTTLLQHRYQGKFICVGNRLRLLHFGRTLLFEVAKIKPYSVIDKDMTSVSNKLNSLKLGDNVCFSEVDSKSKERTISDGAIFYSVIRNTNWIVHKTGGTSQDKGQEISLSDLGGMGDLIKEVTEIMDLALGNIKPIPGVRPTRGVLLHGPAGAGKSMVARALAAASGVTVTHTHGSEVVDGSWSPPAAGGPRILVLDDVDCVPRGASSALCRLLDRMNAEGAFFILLATTRNLDRVDAALRRPGRLEREVEVGVPSPGARLEVLRRILPSVEDAELSRVAAAAHGMVPADLMAVASQASLASARRGAPVPERQDFDAALARVRPTAIREVLVQVPDVRWSDIGGQHDLKLKLRQAVEWPLLYPDAFSRLGISPPRGVLMFGPPGCSKTMVAKALATESGLNFISIKGPELFSKWVGESERAVREVFRRARLVAPAIVFFDELDALGGMRGDSGGGGAGVQDRVLAQLLTEMDGVTPLGNVIVVGATNRPDRIDKALLRPGRLDRIVYVPLPDAETRREILALQLGPRTPIAQDVDMDDLVAATDGYSGAEVTAVCHEAALKALEEDLETKEVTRTHLQAALTRVTPRTPPSLLKLYEEYLRR